MKTVAKKLLIAIKKVGGRVEKTGYNTYSKYKYITESDVNEAVLPALIEQGLLLTTSIDNLIEYPADKDSKNRFATVHLTHTIIDTDSGETLTFKSAGTAADTLDKSIYKAYTGACKYFLLKTFMISGDDSDPENDSVAIKAKITKSNESKPEEKKSEAPKFTLGKPKLTTAPKLEKKKPEFGIKKLNPADLPDTSEETVEVEFGEDAAW